MFGATLVRSGVILILSVFALACGPAEKPAAPPAASADKKATPESTAPASDKKLTIGVMPKLKGIDYFNAVEKGAKEAGAELGVELVYEGPVTNDVTQQAQMLDTWIARKFDAIAIAPNDPDAIVPALEKAKKRGIAIVTWDADAQPQSRDWFCNQATYEDIAQTLMDVMAQNVSESAKFIYITGSLTADNQNRWMEMMEAYRKEKYPQMVNLSETPKATEEDQALATQVTTDSLKTYPDLQGIFALTSVALPGAAEALRKEGAADRVFLTGLSTPKGMKQYVHDDTVKKFVLWSPVDLGYLAVHAAVATANGDLKPGAQSFIAGRLNEVEVNKDEIVLGPPLIFDKANIDQYDF